MGLQVFVCVCVCTRPPGWLRDLIKAAVFVVEKMAWVFSVVQSSPPPSNAVSILFWFFFFYGDIYRRVLAIQQRWKSLGYDYTIGTVFILLRGRFCGLLRGRLPLLLGVLLVED